MAKKRLSEVTKVATAGNNDYIVMNAADGKTVQIKKGDLTEAIADAMRLATEQVNGLMPADDKGRNRKLGASTLPTPYNWVCAYKIPLSESLYFSFFSRSFSDSPTISSVVINVLAHYRNVNGGVPVLQVTTSGGVSHPMNNNGCSIAYAADGRYLYIYLPYHVSYQAQVHEVFRTSQYVERTDISYAINDLTNVSKVSVEGGNVN